MTQTLSTAKRQQTLAGFRVRSAERPQGPSATEKGVRETVTLTTLRFYLSFKTFIFMFYPVL